MFLRRLAALVLLAAALIPTASSTHAQAAAPTCTKTGTAGSDRLVGTSGKDVLCGKGGNDVLIGKGGNDVLLGGGGKDRMVGGPGADRHDGGTGIDTVSYADRTAPVTARLGGSSSGTTGERDAIVAAEALEGGAGDDALTGDGADNTLIGGDGDDTLVGGAGSDAISGDNHDDVLLGGPGIDDLDGGDGVNTCDSSPGEPDESSCRYDVEGPEIETLTVSQETFSPGDTLTIEAEVTDPAGVFSAGVYFTILNRQNDFCGQRLQRVAGTARAGTWRMTCTVPETVRNGDYTVTPYARDIMNNYTNVNGGRDDDTRASFTVTGGVDDSAGPSIESVTTNLETYQPGDPFVLSVHIVDESGTDFVHATLSIGAYTREFCDSNFFLVSGTPQDGIWRMSCELPETVRNGAYDVMPYARDVVGNWTNSNGGTLDDTRGSFTVTGASDDVDPPQVLSMETDAPSYAPGDSFTLTMHVTDATGADLVGAYFTRSGVQNDFCDQFLTRTGGTAVDGTWTLQCTLPSTAPVGTYTAHPYARDVIGNWSGVNGPPIGLTATFDIVE